MQDIHGESLIESVKSEQSPRVVLWEIDLTVQGGERYFFCNELNEKGEAVTWQGREYQAYPIDGSGFEMNGKGSSARPSLTVSNLFGLVTGMAEDLQSLVGATVVRRRVYARFLDAVNFRGGQSGSGPEQVAERPLGGGADVRADGHDSLVCAGNTDGDGRSAVSRSHYAGEYLYVGLPGR
ncbi:phage minor tail protein L [Escherichia coli B7-1]|nr:phage minor tail protein L [Escherichia coli B7-1]